MTLLRTRTFHAMGSPCELRLAAPDTPQADRWVRLVVDDVQRLERRYSRYRDDSDLSAINRVAAAGGSVEVDDETRALLNYAHTCHGQSDGLFDITSGVLRQAWHRGRTTLPDRAQVRSLLPRVGWHRVRWEPPRLTFTVPGMEIDFGGIVKEYAADRAAALLQQAGLRHGLVNLGGDVRIVGPQPDGSPWCIGVRHPRRPGELCATLALASGALATSGDYERCIVIDSVRHGHVLDPRTGWPVRGLASVTVAAPLCVVAGSATTIAMLKARDGPAWLAGMALPHLWVDTDGHCGGSLAEAHTADDPAGGTTTDTTRAGCPESPSPRSGAAPRDCRSPDSPPPTWSPR